ncbi:hypothetical protein [Streptomyces fructofermentans]|uniref:Uncharacterized protein n=1 Tax=Streptomyces fructofermentans TaxID=152141 RepID=A0A918K1Z6_9ACTN|nr:hypothetical protein [Streptomyces fructofermentans]GGX43974.1 hypothetical protein GCM10010515_08550 [Streptomyces fructofermentans]
MSVALRSRTTGLLLALCLATAVAPALQNPSAGHSADIAVAAAEVTSVAPAAKNTTGWD